MERNLVIVRSLAAAAAVAIVGGSIIGLGSYSNAKFELVAASAAPSYAQDMERIAIQPSRIDVVALRLAPTRTAAHVDEAQVPRPQS